MSPEKMEIMGLKSELTGLIVVLVSVIWQATLSGWWDRELILWDGYRQYEAQVAMLESLRDFNELQQEKNPQIREMIITENRQRLVKATSRAWHQDDSIRHTTSEGQAALVSYTQGFLLVLGACLFVIGKWLVLVAAQTRYTDDS